MAVPISDLKLVPYSTNTDARLTVAPSIYHMDATEVAAYSNLHERYISAVESVVTAREAGVRSKATTAAKNAARTDLLRLARDIYGSVAASSTISDADKILLGVNIRDVKPSPAPVPTERPMLAIEAVVGRTLTVSIGPNEAGDRRRRRDDGITGAYVYSFVGEDYPSDPSQWLFQGNAMRDSYDVTLGENVVAGARVWVCCSFVNRRAEGGPVSLPVSANVQGGGVQTRAKAA